MLFVWKRSAFWKNEEQDDAGHESEPGWVKLLF